MPKVSRSERNRRFWARIGAGIAEFRLLTLASRKSGQAHATDLQGVLFWSWSGIREYGFRKEVVWHKTCKRLKRNVSLPRPGRVLAMKYGQIAGNKRINAFIYHCFEYISEEDVQKFVKKFCEQPQNSSEIEIMHTFRELILGAYLCSKGLRGRYDYNIGGKTPDWSLFDENSNLCALVELTNFHLDLATESEIEDQLSSKRVAVVWRDANKDNIERLYQAIWHKAGVYQKLVQEKRISYVVAVFGEFRASTDFEEVCLCLTDKESGLFNMYPELSGVLYFEERSGSYSFNYANNPSALHPITLPGTNAFLFRAG